MYIYIYIYIHAALRVAAQIRTDASSDLRANPHAVLAFRNSVCYRFALQTVVVTVLIYTHVLPYTHVFPYTRVNHKPKKHQPVRPHPLPRPSRHKPPHATHAHMTAFCMLYHPTSENVTSIQKHFYNPSYNEYLNT